MTTGVQIGFWVLAVISVGSALMVVSLRDIFRAALFLVLCFVSVAGNFVTLEADFVAAVQVLIYAGAISILLLFAIMLTRDTRRGSPTGRLHSAAMFVATLIGVTLIVVALNTDWPKSTEAPLQATTAAIGDALFDRFVLPFEVASVLLLAALIGSIALARED